MAILENSAPESYKEETLDLIFAGFIGKAIGTTLEVTRLGEDFLSVSEIERAVIQARIPSRKEMT